MKTVAYNVNLIPKDPFFTTPIGKVLKWALSVGRYIVVFTELIVIFSFLTRFSLDRQVTDLNETIARKRTIIESYGTLEDDVTRVQAILQEYDQIAAQENITEVFPEMSRIVPSDVVLTEFVIRPGQVSFSGLVTSQNSLNALISNIQLSQRFFNVSVDRIESTEDVDVEGFDFVIRADTRREQGGDDTGDEIEKVNILDRSADF